MIKNIIFDFGNIIIRFKASEMTSYYTNDRNIQKFLEENVIHSPEWLGEGRLDLGEITLSEMADNINKRTNNIYKDEVYNFSTDFPNKLKYNGDIIRLIKELKEKGYKLYLLSNTSDEVFRLFIDELNPLFDGMVLSYKIHQIKPNKPIYESLLNKYDLNPEECLFLDDKQDNMDTANSMRINGRKINPDDYQDIVNALKEYNIL